MFGRTLSFVNAGHNPSLFKAPAAEIKLLNADDIALGVKDEIELDSGEVALKKEDVLVLYTDGVTEACNEMDEEYGVERLQQMIESVRSLPSKEIIEAVVWENTTFAGARPQFDDIVLEAGIGLEDKAGQPPASPYEPRRAFPEEP